MHVIYFALYQSIYQYGLLVWDGLSESSIRKLQTNQINILRISLNKYSLLGTTKQNYRVLDVLSNKFLYK